VGHFMQQMELPFTYLYDLPVLLLESRKLRTVFIETKLMQREVQFVTGSDDNTVRLWNRDGKEEGKEMDVGSTVTCVDITHDWLFAGARSGKVHKFHRSDQVLSQSEQIHNQEITSLTVALGFVLTTSNDHTIKMSGIENLELIHKFHPKGLGRLNCVTVGIEFCFAGGDNGAHRLSHVNPEEEATPIDLAIDLDGDTRKDKLPHISLMALDGRSLFMASKGLYSEGEVYFVRDARTLEEATLSAKVVWKAEEEVRSLALGGKDLFVATTDTVYKLNAAKPQDGPYFAINVAPVAQQDISKVVVFRAFGEIAIVGYFPGSKELGIFNTNSGRRIAMTSGAFQGHKHNIGCIAAG